MTNKTRSTSEIPVELRRVLFSLIAGEFPWPLTLWSLPGRGKTCAALAVLDRVAEIQPKWRGRYIHGRHYWTVHEFYQLALDVRFGRREGVGMEDLRRGIESAALIVLDELDRAEELKDGRVEEILELIDRREGMPLILLSNSPPDVLGQIYGARLPSRLANGVILKMEGSDRRIHKQ